MRLSTKARYGARALVDLALARPEGATCVRDIAERQCISPKYLEQIMARLKAAGLVKALRGRHGGYALSRPAASITIKELFEVLEGPVAAVECVDDPASCPMSDVCPTRETWVQMKQALQNVLEQTSVQDLVDRENQR